LLRLERSRIDFSFEIFQRCEASALRGAVRRRAGKSVEGFVVERVQLVSAAGCQFKSGDEFHRFLRLLEAPTTGAFLAPDERQSQAKGPDGLWVEKTDQEMKEVKER